MARPLSFEPAVALDKAMRLFWRDGYDRVSIQTITATLGINRPSLYATFGDKEALFLKALQLYRDAYPAKILAALRSSPGGKRAILAMFDLIKDTYTEVDSPPGCMIMATIQSWTKPGPVLDFLQARQEEFEKAMMEAVTTAQRNGEIAAGKDAKLVTAYLHFTVKSIAMEARLTKDRAHVGAMIDQALASL